MNSAAKSSLASRRRNRPGSERNSRADTIG
jgi:hypothetical protein